MTRGMRIGFPRDIRVSADTGSYGITGNAAGTNKGYAVQAGQGSYAINGIAANLVPAGTSTPSWNPATPLPDPIPFIQGTASNFPFTPYTTNFNPTLHKFQQLTGTLPSGVTLNQSTGLTYDGIGSIGSTTGDSWRIANIQSSADADFLARSTAPGVFRVRNWTSNADLGGGFGAEFGNLTQGANPAPVIDTVNKPFGNGSLRYNVTPILGGSMWWTNCSPDLSLQFGSAAGGETIYFQFPYMVSAEIPPTYAAKIFLFGTGDTPGVFQTSCTDLEIELNSQIFGQKFLAAYNACPGSCGANSVFVFFPQGNPGGQQFLQPNVWMTIKVGITLGPLETHIGHDWFVNSNVKIWIQYGIGPEILVYDWTGGQTPGSTPSSSPPCYGLCAGQSVGTGQRYGKLWLLPYNQELTGSNQQPGTIWYGPLIMSTQNIAARLA